MDATADPQPTLRHRIERASEPLLGWLTRQPKLLLPVLAAGLLIAGLTAPASWGAVLLAVLLSLLGWLSYLSWPVLHRPQRVLRGATLGLLTAITVEHLLS